MLTALLFLVPGLSAASLQGEALVLAMPQGPATGIGIVAEGPLATFASGEMRGTWGGEWTGRATGGFDLLGSGENLDLTLGLFLGGHGNLMALQGLPAAGFELGLGVGIGPLKLRYRHIHGGAETEGDCAWTERLTSFAENELRLSYDLGRRWVVFGEVVDLTPSLDEPERQNAYGMGARLVF